MPNNITNIIKIKGKNNDIREFIKDVKSKHSLFDFNRIVPTPDYVDPQSVGEDWKPNGKYTTNWYEWNIKNWGTKWNAYNIYYDIYYKNELTVVFDTAWSTPEPIREKLAIQYPNLSFNIKYADEDIDNNCGVFNIENGILYYENKEGDRKFSLSVKNKNYSSKIGRYITEVKDFRY